MESESIKLPQTTRALWYEVYSLRRSLKRRKDHNIEDYERLNAVVQGLVKRQEETDREVTIKIQDSHIGILKWVIATVIAAMSIMLGIIAINADTVYIRTHPGITHQYTGFFPIKPIRRNYIGRGISIGNRCYIKTEHVTVADHRFHFINIFLYTPDTVAIKTQLVHCFQHSWMYIITLKSNMIVVADKIGFACQHFHQEILMAERRFEIQINQCIHTTGFNQFFIFCIGMVL